MSLIVVQPVPCGDVDGEYTGIATDQSWMRLTRIVGSEGGFWGIAKAVVRRSPSLGGT